MNRKLVEDWPALFFLLVYQIFKGETQIPKWLSPGARRIIQRILDPDPKTRITVEGIKADDWFKVGYTPAVENDAEDDDLRFDHEEFSIKEVAIQDSTRIYYLFLFFFFYNLIQEIVILYFSFLREKASEIRNHDNVPTFINAFELIGMSSCLDLSGFFENEVRFYFHCP